MLYNIIIEINCYYSFIQAIEESKTSVLQTECSEFANTLVVRWQKRVGEVFKTRMGENGQPKNRLFRKLLIRNKIF
jgi:hypothetical protein